MDKLWKTFPLIHKELFVMSFFQQPQTDYPIVFNSFSTGSHMGRDGVFPPIHKPTTKTS